MNAVPECVWLLRHAETRTPDVFHGAESDVDLSALGERQAAALGLWLRDLRPDVVVSSAMLRARRTAAAAAEACTVPHAIEPLLHERRVGVLSGQPFDTVSGLWADTVAAWSRGDIDYTTPDAESYREVRQRALLAWSRLLEAHAGKRVVVVAHGITCKVLLLSLLPDFGPTGWHRLGRMANASVTPLSFQDDFWRADHVAVVPDPVAALNDGKPTGLGILPGRVAVSVVGLERERL